MEIFHMKRVMQTLICPFQYQLQMELLVLAIALLFHLNVDFLLNDC